MTIEQEAKELLRRITPGDWHAPGLGEVHSDHDKGIYARVVGSEDDAVIADLCNTADAEFIAAAPRLMRALLAELATIRATIEAQRTLVAKWREYLVTSRAEGLDARARGDLRESNARKTEASMLAACIAELAATLPPQEGSNAS